MASGPIDPLLRLPEQLRPFWNPSNPEYSYNDSTAFTWTCPHCTYQWQASTQSMLSRKYPCRICCPSTTPLQRRMYHALKHLQQDHKIHSFSFHKYLAKDIGYADFWLITLDQRCIAIETDCQHHFFWYSQFPSRLANIKRRDQVKNQWCRDNNIPLLRVSFSVPAHLYTQHVLDIVKAPTTVPPILSLIGEEYSQTQPLVAHKEE